VTVKWGKVAQNVFKNLALRIMTVGFTFKEIKKMFEIKLACQTYPIQAQAQSCCCDNEKYLS